MSMNRVYPTVGMMGVGVGLQVPAGTENDWWNSMDTIAPGLSDVSADEGWNWSDIIANTTEFLQALVVTEQQRTLIKANLERARSGQPPLTASEVGMGLSVGMDSNTRRMVFIVAGGALILGGLAIYSNSRRGR